VNLAIPLPADVAWRFTAEAFATAYACNLWSEAISLRDRCGKAEVGLSAYREYHRAWEKAHGIRASLSSRFKAEEFVRSVLACAYPVPLPPEHELWMRKWPSDNEAGCQWKRKWILSHWQHWFGAVIAPALTEVCKGRKTAANAIVESAKNALGSETEDASRRRRVDTRLAEIQQPSRSAPPARPLRKPGFGSSDSATHDSEKRGGFER